MTAQDKITGIREQLDAIAPLPEDGPVTATALARYFAVRAQERFSKMLHPAMTIEPQQVSAMGAEFAAAHALYALADEGKPARSDVTASQIWDAISDGGGIGEWLWEYLREDADKVAKLAEEMAAAQAELAAKAVAVDA